MFLQNNWYVAAFSDELNDGLLSRTFLNEHVVLYRRSDGSPAALFDQCPHRFLPLSKGVLIDDEVRCGYHGLQFNHKGMCTRVPTQSHIPETARVRSYPVVDKFGIVWIWFGEEEAANPDEIPDWDIDPGLSHHEDDNWASCKDYFRPEANCSLVVDNLLDLSHIVYVHGSSFGSEDINNVEVNSKIDELRISDRRSISSGKPGPAFVGLVGDENTDVDFWMDMHWQAPSNLLLEFGVTPPGKKREEGFQWIASHLLTPETDKSTHYFWVVSRSFDQDNKQLTAQWHDTVYDAFEEDSVILRCQQQALGDRELMTGMKPIILGADTSAIQARRINSRLLRAQDTRDTALIPSKL